MRTWLALLLAVALCAAADADADSRPPCAFYCFHLTDKTDPPSSLNRSLTGLAGLRCTHLVYGYAEVSANGQVDHPNEHDLELDASFGNFRALNSLRFGARPMKTLIAVREAAGVHFLDSADISGRVARNIAQLAETNNFDGIFLDLNGVSITSFHFRRFVDSLRAATQKELVLALSASGVFRSAPVLKKYLSDFGVFYLKTDEVFGELRPTETLLLTPLYAGQGVRPEDALSNAAEELTKAGVPRADIVVGLSSWARGYAVEQPEKAAMVNQVLGLPPQARANGRLSYQQVCKVAPRAEWHYDKNVSAVWTVGTDEHWYSLLPPQHEATDRVLTWVAGREFGGVGLVQLQADDPEGACGPAGAFPLHKYVSEQFKCSRREAPRGNNVPCKRVCIYQPEREAKALELRNFQSEWCSHYVVSSLDFNSLGHPSAGRAVRDALDKFEGWSAKAKPLLLLSLGDEVDARTWRTVVKADALRAQLVTKVAQFVKNSSADGLVVSWTKGTISRTSAFGRSEAQGFHELLKELRKALPPPALLVVTATLDSTAAMAYDARQLNRLADFVLVESFRFHRPDMEITGHPSALLSHSELLTNSTLTVESLALMWSSLGLPRDKIVLEFSAQVMTQGLATGVRSAQDSPIGQKAVARSSTNRAMGDGVMSQTELCASAGAGALNKTFITELGVPVAQRESEFFAFDDTRSMRLKTVWTSLARFGGVALHGLEMDNPHGECPQGKPYPLLQTVVSTQICEQCAANAEPVVRRACQPEPFRVVCSYRLPDANDKKPLATSAIPLDLCTELVVEEALLSADLSISFRDETARAHLDELQKVQRGEKRAVSAVRCNMTSQELRDGLEKRSLLIDSLLRHMEAHHFDGLELRCDDVLEPESRAAFNQFLKALMDEAQSRRASASSECPPTVGLRIPVWQTELGELYEVSTLNRLHVVVLEPFQVETNRSQLISPLFSPAQGAADSIDATLAAWLAQGVKPANVLLHLPAYGIAQHLTEARVGGHVGDEVDAGTKVLSQQELCRAFRQPGVDKHVMFDFVSAFATTPDNQWLSFETQQTMTYKIKYAIREQLAGVGLLTINEDDHADVCKQGAFPLLKSIRAAVC